MVTRPVFGFVKPTRFNEHPMTYRAERDGGVGDCAPFGMRMRMMTTAKMPSWSSPRADA